uniref:Uncharacterized protein n=1 Tax=Tetraselmis sp. GSL018 TaxID=582737 RepID=A0A061S5B3_9CHLO
MGRVEDKPPTPPIHSAASGGELAPDRASPHAGASPQPAVAAEGRELLRGLSGVPGRREEGRELPAAVGRPRPLGSSLRQGALCCCCGRSPPRALPRGLSALELAMG